MDFYCVAERIVLALEGDVHDSVERQGYDRARADFLTAAGYRVIRMRNRDVSQKHLKRVLRQALRKPALRSPSPEGRGGQGVRTPTGRLAVFHRSHHIAIGPTIASARIGGET
jgi:Protein of unknown function (DUF559)